MPWSPGDAPKHTKRASTPAKKKQWAAVADASLSRGQSEGVAVRQANAVVAKSANKKAVAKKAPAKKK